MRHACTKLALALIVVAASWAPTPIAAQSPEWTIDPAHSAAQFAVRHMMVSTVRGRLGKISGTVRYDGKSVAAIAIDATIDSTGIDTQEPKRDAHLKSADFFDVERFPTLTFKSKRTEAGTAGHFKVVGDLTLHGVTKEVVLDVEGPSPEVRQGAMARVGASATTKIKRSDFGLVWNRAVETGGVLVGDEITVMIDVELVRKTTA